ncbi:1-acyl-sn-glycerol-3-phosphate acyltransferase [Candidatus Woesebacteria bacterium]|nr:1-acyl-sn-glycerol-3-phosphate acyltransferase [Candidatus Woesebacteria bacterium]
MKHTETTPIDLTTKEKVVRKTRKVFAHAMLELLATFSISIEVDEESKQNLAELDKLLLSESVVIISNHTSAIDIVSVLKFIELIDNMRLGCYLIAQKFATPNLNRPISLMLAPFFQLGNMLNILAVPVPQTNKEKDSNKFDRVKEYEVLRDSLLAEVGNVLGIMPEGTRGKSDDLNRLKPGGLGNLAIRYQDMMFISASLVRIDGSKRFQLSVGKAKRASEIVPTIAEDADHIQSLQEQLIQEVDPNTISEIKLQIKARLQIIADQFGYEIADLLPENMRGVYAAKIG